MEGQLYLISNIIIITVTISSLIAILSITYPPDNQSEKRNGHAIAKKFLVCAYSALFLFIGIRMLNGAPIVSREILAFSLLFIFSLEVELMAFTLLSLIDPDYPSLKKTLACGSPLIAFSLLYAVFLMIGGKDPEIHSMTDFNNSIGSPAIWIRLGMFAFFLFELVYYPILFYKRLNSKRHAEATQPENSDIRWAKWNVFPTMGIALTALVSLFVVNIDAICVFTLLFTIYFLGFSVLFLRHNMRYNILVGNTGSRRRKHKERMPIEAMINQLLDKEPLFFTRQGITVENVARKLGISRTTLSNHLNKQAGITYSEWINHLRINYAKKMILEENELSISAVSDKVGFSEPTNFIRQFKKCAEETPLQWKKKQKH